MNRPLRTLFIFNGIFVFSSGLLGPLYALYVSGIENSVLAVSGSWAAFMVSSTFFTFLMFKLGDRVVETEYFLILGYFIRAVVWFSYIFAGNLLALFLLQIFLGLGEALGTPSYDALFAQHLNKGKYVRDYSVWKMISTLVGAAATLIGGLIVSTYGFVPLFIVMGTLAVISMLGIFLTPRNLL